MNQMPHDPDSLDDELERLLTAGQSDATTPTDPLVEAAARLNAAPRPRLSPEAADRIRALTLAAHRAAPKSSPVRRLPQQVSARLALVAAVGLLLIAVTVFAARSTLQFLSAPPKIDSILTETLTQTPSATFTATNTLPAILPTTVQATATTGVEERSTTISPATNTPAPTFIPTTAAPTLTPILPSATATLPLPEATATAPLPIRISIQGPVQTIDGNLITIFDITVRLQPNDPVLATLRIGDTLRVEGQYVPALQTVIAVEVTRVIATTSESATPGTPGNAESNPNPNSSNPETNVNPSSGEVWVDTGDCSNPPPPWAPANGWRRRCESIDTPSAQGNGNSGSGNSNSGGNSDNGNGNGNNGNSGNGNGRGNGN
jgi:uncharacterized membrane protein YgcG